MISEQQAEKIANDIIAKARASSPSIEPTRGRQIPRMYRCPELDALPHRSQLEIMQRAQRAALNKPAFIALTALMLIGVGFACAGTPHTTTVLLLLSLYPVVAVPLQHFLMRREVKAIALQVHAAMAQAKL